MIGVLQDKQTFMSIMQRRGKEGVYDKSHDDCVCQKLMPLKFKVFLVIYINNYLKIGCS